MCLYTLKRFKMHVCLCVLVHVSLNIGTQTVWPPKLEVCTVIQHPAQQQQRIHPS